MMKMSIGLVLAIGLAALTGACVADDEQRGEDTAHWDEHRSTLYSVPEELAAAPLPGMEIFGNQATTNSCRVTLVYCHDPRHSGFPSFCSNGCSSQQALNAASSLCLQVCGSGTNCYLLWGLGSC